MPLKLIITNEQGEVFDVLKQGTRGYWYDSDGEEVAQGVAQLTLRVLPDILGDASAWAKAKERES